MKKFTRRDMDSLKKGQVLLAQDKKTKTLVGVRIPIDASLAKTRFASRVFFELTTRVLLWSSSQIWQGRMVTIDLETDDERTVVWYEDKKDRFLSIKWDMALQHPNVTYYVFV